MAQWFRLYESTLDDPKVQKLAPKYFKAWINLLCLASRNDGEVPSIDDIAFALRVTKAEAEDIFSLLFNSGLFDRDDDGRITPHNWSSRQYKSDGSAERMRRHRERHRNGVSDVTVTPSEQSRAESDTETDTEIPDAKASGDARRKDPANEQIKLPSDWRPATACRDYASDKGLDPDSVADAFTDYFTQGRGKREKRTCTGWEKRWRVWCNTDAERKPAARGIRPASTGGDAGAFARAAARMGRDEPVQ